MIKVDLEKSYDKIDIKAEFTQKSDEILAIIGHSGCGKTTVLNMISGLVKPDCGKVTINNNVIFDSITNINTPLNERNMGYVEQRDTIFPHLTVKENILYGRRKNKKYTIDIDEVIDFLEIKDILNKTPRQISGGQRQRVAIARALISEPQILLMDEPFSALDNVIREKLRDIIREIKVKFNIPIIFITHDLAEAYTIGDRIAIMKKGRILDMDAPDNIYFKPKSIEIAKFIGVKNILSNDEGKALLNYLGYDEIYKDNVGDLHIGIHSHNIEIVVDYNISKSNAYGIINKFVRELNGIKYEIKVCCSHDIILNVFVPNKEIKGTILENGSKVYFYIEKSSIMLLR